VPLLWLTSVTSAEGLRTGPGHLRTFIKHHPHVVLKKISSITIIIPPMAIIRVLFLKRKFSNIFFHTHIHDNILITPATSRWPRQVRLSTKTATYVHKKLQYIKLLAAV